MQGSRIFILRDRNAALRQYRTSVETRFHPHDRYAGLAVAREERALDRRRAAPARQQRRMNIQGPLRCDIKERRRQEHAVSGDYHSVGAGSAHACRHLGGLQRFRLENFQTVPLGEALDRAGRNLLPAAGGAIWLGEHQHDVMAGPVQGRERLLRELRSASES